MKYLIAILVMLLSISGCVESTASQSGAKRVQMRHSAYLGKKLGLFILSNGVPYRSSRLSNGGKRYAWNSKKPDIHPYTPSSKRESDHWMESACELVLYADRYDRIYRIEALNDPRQDWDVDACAAYLK